MPVQRPLTVRDTLLSPHFAQALVAAGSSGLDREIRWVHILEISEADELLHGGEMILTTGVGFRGRGGRTPPLPGYAYPPRSRVPVHRAWPLYGMPSRGMDCAS